MNKSFLTQAIILIAIGAVLSPSIYFLFFASYPDDQAGFHRLISYIVFPLPALASVICLALGLGRLHAARTQPATTVGYVSVDDLAHRSQEYRRRKSNLTALIIVTVLLGIIGLLMLAIIIYLLERSYVWLIFPGAIPVALFLLACVVVPLNIRNILKEKKILYGIERS